MQQVLVFVAQLNSWVKNNMARRPPTRRNAIDDMLANVTRSANEDPILNALNSVSADPLQSALTRNSRQPQGVLDTLGQSLIGLFNLQQPQQFPEEITPMSEEFSKKSFFDHIKPTIARNEGKRDYIYQDTKGKWTTGVGHLIGDGSLKSLNNSPFSDVERRVRGAVVQKGRRLTEDEIDKTLEGDLNRIYDSAVRLTPNWNTVSNETKEAIFDATFRGDWGLSKNTRKLFAAGKFGEAATEFLDNDDYRKSKRENTGIWKRMERIAKAINDEQLYRDRR